MVAIAVLSKNIKSDGKFVYLSSGSPIKIVIFNVQLSLQLHTFVRFPLIPKRLFYFFSSCDGAVSKPPTRSTHMNHTKYAE